MKLNENQLYALKMLLKTEIEEVSELVSTSDSADAKELIEYKSTLFEIQTIISKWYVLLLGIEKDYKIMYNVTI